MTEMKRMKAMRGFALAGMLAIAGVVATPAAKADVLLTEASTFITGTEANTYKIFASTAGKVTVMLADMDWPEKFQSLSFQFISPTGKLAELTAPGTLEFDLSAAGLYTAIVSGTANSAGWNVGMYALRVGLTPNGSPVVPLPPAIGLLLMGLASSWGLTRKRHVAPVV